MKKSFILLVILALNLSGCTQKASNSKSTPKTLSYTEQSSHKKSDFSKSNWGDSMDKVKATEGKKNTSPDQNSYIFETIIAGTPCYAGFKFIHNKLVQGTYFFTQRYGNYNNYIDDYKRIVRLLTKVYGAPKKELEDWKDESVFTKDDPNDYGFALSQGYLSYFASWENSRTKVETCLRTGDNYSEIFHAIQYTEKGAQSLIDEKEVEGL